MMSASSRTEIPAPTAPPFQSVHPSQSRRRAVALALLLILSAAAPLSWRLPEVLVLFSTAAAGGGGGRRVCKRRSVECGDDRGSDLVGSPFTSAGRWKRGGDLWKRGGDLWKMKIRDWLMNETKKNNGDIRGCLRPSGPKPFVLMSIGRSGSGATLQIISNLTGLVTPPIELTGTNREKSIRFFEEIGNDEGGMWIYRYMCMMQREYPKAGVVGFKWMPYYLSNHSEPVRQALELLAAAAKSESSACPQIRVVRLRRNVLDVFISMLKHRTAKEDGDHGVKIEAHCRRGDVECMKQHKAVGTGLLLRTDKLLGGLGRVKGEEDKVDNMLKKIGVPTVHVSYEKLYLEKDPEEWMRIFRFLGVGPAEGLKWGDVEGAMDFMSTAISQHNVTMANFEEVRDLLGGTEFEGLLH